MSVTSQACKVYVRAHGASVWTRAGGTTGGVTVTNTPTYTDCNLDEYGTSPIEKILSGEEASVSGTFGVYDKDALELCLPMGTVYTQGANEAIGIGRNVGVKLTDHTFEMKIHPINTLGASGGDDETYLADDYTFFKVANAGDLSDMFNTGEQKTLDFTFYVFHDSDRTMPNMYIIGDPDIVNSPTTGAPAILSSNPADGATAVVVSDDILLYTSLPIRMATTTTPDGNFQVFNDLTHAEIACTVTAEQTVTGDVTSATATTLVIEAGDIFADDCLNGAYVEITDGTGKSSTLVAITDSVESTNTLTVAAWPSGTPDSTSSYKLHVTAVTINPDSSLASATKFDVIASAMRGVNAETSEAEVFSFTTA